MLSYSQIHDAPLQQLVRWWSDPASVSDDLDEGQALDEVAYGLSKYVVEGTAILKRSLNGGDIQRRWAALSSLARPNLADSDVRAALVDAFSSTDVRLLTAALWGFIDLGYFPLTEVQVSDCLGSEDDRLAALAMVYQCRANPKKELSILRSALRSPNPREREYACDEIGDRNISDLVTEMRALLDDTDTEVVRSAESNLELFE